MPQALQSPLEWPIEGQCAGAVPGYLPDPEIYRTERDRVFLGRPGNISRWPTSSPSRRLQDNLPRRDAGHRHPRRGRPDPRDGQPLRPSRQSRLPEAARPYQGRADLRLPRLALRPRRNLKSVAFRRGVGGKGGMPDSFRPEEHGLKKLRTDQFAGLVFGTLSPEAPPLLDYIGNDIGGGSRVMRGKPKILAPPRRSCHNNWKLYVENVKDTYHASLLHTFFTTFRISRLTTAGGVAIAESAPTMRATPMASSAATTPPPTRPTARSTRCTTTTGSGIRASRIGRRNRRRHHLADPQRLPEFRVAADPQFDRGPACAAEGAGRNRVAMDL